MKITVSYHAQDVYDIPDTIWRTAMLLHHGDEDDAFNYLLEGGLDDCLCTSDVTDRWMEVEKN
jgi:hypothetical protein